jgi:hypothetical protein
VSTISIISQLIPNGKTAGALIWQHLRRTVISHFYWSRSKTNLLIKQINGPSTQQFLLSSSDVSATTCFGHTTILLMPNVKTVTVDCVFSLFQNCNKYDTFTVLYFLISYSDLSSQKQDIWISVSQSEATTPNRMLSFACDLRKLICNKDALLLYFSILLHCIVQWVLQVMFPSACSFIACWFYRLSLHLSACVAIFKCVGYLFSYAWRILLRCLFGSLPFFHVVTLCMFSIRVLFCLLADKHTRRETTQITKENSAVWRLLRKRLHLMAYKLSIIQHLEVTTQ